METFVMITAITLIVVLSFLLGEALPLVLPRVAKCFDRKPFNCRPCFTFHLHWFGMTVIATIARNPMIAFSGVVTAFVVFVIVRYVENKKVIE